LVKYDLLGFDGRDDYLKYFVDSLIPTNRTYNYYVDWEKIQSNLEKKIAEINILNSLIHVNPDERKNKLKDIIYKYPDVVGVIPLIIAVRDSNLLILEISDDIYFKEFDFTSNYPIQQKLDSDVVDSVGDLVDFCDKSGIIDLLGRIKDLYTYLTGVEVGLDSNARKNRSGKIFEQIVELFLKSELKKLGKDYYLKCEDSSIKIGKSKRIDFVVYKNHRPLIAIECNFYWWSGGKGIEVAGSYADLQRRFKDKGLEFIWVTDGPGWSGMKSTLISAFEDIDFLLNYRILEKNFVNIVNDLSKE
jgi:type II restriction enzyme